MGTIKSSREIDSIFRAAKRVTTPLLIVLVAQTPKERGLSGRVAFIAGKKLGGAVLRNRSRRVLRASMQRVGGPWPGNDVLLIARPGLATAGADDVDGGMRDALKRARVL